MGERCVFVDWEEVEQRAKRIALTQRPQRTQNSQRRVDQKIWTDLFRAGARWAGSVMPPPNGLREVVKMTLVTALIAFLPGVLVSVKPGPSAFVSDSGLLRFVSGESRDRCCSEQDACTGEDKKMSLHQDSPF